MPMTTVKADTPYYVLRAENRRIGPQVVPADTGKECFPVYGFSDKESYKRFCLNSPLALAPYPLVKGYLRNQAGAAGDGLKLVVLNAAGPREPYLHAATVEAVLEAHENRTIHVAVAYRLTFDPEANAYRVEKSSI